VSEKSSSDGSRRKFLKSALKTSLGCGAFLAPSSPLAEVLGLECHRALLAQQKNGRKRGMNEKLSTMALGQLHESMSGYTARGEVPGLVALIARGDEVHVDALGTAAVNGQQSQPVRHDTIFRIASMTKAIAAVATMMLIEESKLKLDEPVDRLLPELANRKVLKRPDGPIDDTVPANASHHRARPADVSLGHGFAARGSGDASDRQENVRAARRRDSVSGADATYAG
jgi:hypothetical protein